MLGTAATGPGPHLHFGGRRGPHSGDDAPASSSAPCPGIGSTVAVAIILPFTLGMGQIPAILLVLADLCRLGLWRIDFRHSDQHAPARRNRRRPALTAIRCRSVAKAGAGAWLGHIGIGCRWHRLGDHVDPRGPRQVAAFALQFRTDRDLRPDPARAHLHRLGFRRAR